MKSLVLRYAAFVMLLFADASAIAGGTDSLFTKEELGFEVEGFKLSGSLFMPAGKKGKVPLVLIIGGSGPVNRDGNSPKYQASCYRKMAYELALKGIASYRYDKRGVGKSATAKLNEEDLRFKTFVDDAEACLEMLKSDRRFSKIVIVGHGEGALIGAEIANKGAAKFISIDGAGRRADEIIKEQLSVQRPSFRDSCYEVVDGLVAGKTFPNLDPNRYVLFRPSAQQYMISWFRYDPVQIYARIKVPVMIVQGTKDLQCNVSEASYLALALPKAKLLLIENMNYVMVLVTGNKESNMKSYGLPQVRLSRELLSKIEEFTLEK